ncbi:Pih1 protein [Saccharomycopsis crataegensis]|uniref:Pih1 protein n=1 Tax=Saccharomycopsis crataegensis TaxID=43959 RepID=A0AAV5QDA2_9ASCO|nr:Pih1 protein [Saccharomycopsis crataegensis]
MALVAENEEKIIMDPKSGFVVKTRLETGTADPLRRPLTKVFINICSNQHVPLPDHNNESFKPEIVYPLIMNDRWEIPIITSDEREDTDNKGSLSYVYDCFINDKCMSWVQLHKELRQIVTEWCLESVELRFGVRLDRDVVKYPKLSYKGALTSLEVIKDDIQKKSFQNQKQELERLANEKDHLLMLDAVEESKNKVSEVDDSISIFSGGLQGAGKDKPKIQEIDASSYVSKPKKPSIMDISEANKDPVSSVKKLLNFDLRFCNLMDKSKGYQLLITIKSEIKSPNDYQLNYDSNKKSLLLKNLNPQYRTKTESFEIPVPNYIIKENSDCKFAVYFVKETSTLNIFM